MTPNPTGRPGRMRTPAAAAPPDPGRWWVGGDRVALVRPGVDDRDEFLAAVGASRHLHAPWVEPADTAERYQAYLRRVSRPDTAGWLVRERRTGELAGVVNINAMVWGSLGTGHLGYFGFAATAGRGLVADGVALAVGEAFAHLHLHRLEANIQPGNAASTALVRRLGFRHEGFSPRYMRVGGEWRDHDRWALTVEDAGHLPGHLPGRHPGRRPDGGPVDPPAPRDPGAPPPPR